MIMQIFKEALQKYTIWYWFRPLTRLAFRTWLLYAIQHSVASRTFLLLFLLAHQAPLRLSQLTRYINYTYLHEGSMKKNTNARTPKHNILVGGNK